MSELTKEILESDLRSSPVLTRYIIDKIIDKELWYLWDRDYATVLKTGSLDTVIEELKRREG